MSYLSNLVIQFGIDFKSLGHMTCKLLKRMLIFHNKYTYKMGETIKCIQKRNVLYELCIDTIVHWFGVSGSHDMEATGKKKC